MGGPGSRRLLLIASPILGLALATAACGGGSPRVASLPTTTTGVTGATAPGGSSSSRDLVEFATCMRSHGISNYPDPNSPGAPNVMRAIKQSTASSPEYQDAERACAKYAQPTAPPQRVSPEEMQKLLAVSRCMRAHGVPNFPDPNPTTGELSTPAGTDKNSPQVVAALEACSALGEAAGLGPPAK
jgi:hypothetical protein